MRPFVGLLAPSKTIYSHPNGQDSLTGKAGFSIGAIAARRFGNWSGGLRLGYLVNDYSGSVLGEEAYGEMEFLSLGALLGYGLPLNDKLSFESSFSLGYGSKSNDLTIILPFFPEYYHYSDSSLTFDLGLGLDYKYSEVMSAYLGYRLMGVADNGPFERMTLHLFELGLGANF